MQDALFLIFPDQFSSKQWPANTKNTPVAPLAIEQLLVCEAGAGIPVYVDKSWITRSWRRGLQTKKTSRTVCTCRKSASHPHSAQSYDLTGLCTQVFKYLHREHMTHRTGGGARQGRNIKSFHEAGQYRGDAPEIFRSRENDGSISVRKPSNWSDWPAIRVSQGTINPLVYLSTHLQLDHGNKWHDARL